MYPITRLRLLQSGFINRLFVNIFPLLFVRRDEKEAEDGKCWNRLKPKKWISSRKIIYLFKEMEKERERSIQKGIFF